MSRKLTSVLDRLFVNRDDTYGLQQPNGQYIRIEQPLTLDVLKRHLKGEITVGAYQLSPANLVKWLCLDLDPETINNPLATAQNIIKVYLKRGICRKSLLLEASRFPDNSCHLWVLFEPPVLAKVARWLGLQILELAKLNPIGIEVFPKQTELTIDRPFGNLVKLPLGLHQVEQKRSCFLNLETFEPLSSTCLFDVEGISFSEKDIEKILSFENKKTMQTRFDLPENFEQLPEEMKIVGFLSRYWNQGQRNRVEVAFLGWCLKRGISHESALRIIDQVTKVTQDPERYQRLQLVKYHYKNRRNLGSQLLGISGLRKIVQEALR